MSRRTPKVYATLHLSCYFSTLIIPYISELNMYAEFLNECRCFVSGATWSLEKSDNGMATSLRRGIWLKPHVPIIPHMDTNGETCLVLQDAKIFLSFPILMCICPIIGYLLFHGYCIFGEGIVIESSVVSMILLYADTMCLGILFECEFCFHGFCTIEIALHLNKSKVTVMMYKNCC